MQNQNATSKSNSTSISKLEKFRKANAFRRHLTGKRRPPIFFALLNLILDMVNFQGRLIDKFGISKNTRTWRIHWRIWYMEAIKGKSQQRPRVLGPKAIVKKQVSISCLHDLTYHGICQTRHVCALPHPLCRRHLRQAHCRHRH